MLWFHSSSSSLFIACTLGSNLFPLISIGCNFFCLIPGYAGCGQVVMSSAPPSVFRFSLFPFHARWYPLWCNFCLVFDLEDEERVPNSLTRHLMIISVSLSVLHCLSIASFGTCSHLLYLQNLLYLCPCTTWTRPRYLKLPDTTCVWQFFSW